MDIRNWPLGKIMQLPDCCFGQRWPISISGETTAVAPVFDIAECALPEKTIIWELHGSTVAPSVDRANCILKVGDHLPANAAEFNAMEYLFGCMDLVTYGRSAVEIGTNASIHLSRLRYPVLATGQRFVGYFQTASASSLLVQVTLVVSSVPMEVPDCLVSGLARSL